MGPRGKQLLQTSGQKPLLDHNTRKKYTLSFICLRTQKYKKKIVVSDFDLVSSERLVFFPLNPPDPLRILVCIRHQVPRL